MALQWRILAAFFTVIVLTILTSAGVAYWNTQSRFADFTSEYITEAARDFAFDLSHEYTRAGSWDAVADLWLGDSLYAFEELTTEELTALAIEEAWLSELTSEELDVESIRYVLVDVDDCVLFDSFYELGEGECVSDLPEERSPVIDFRSREEVGYVIADPESVFWDDESNEFLGQMYSSTIIGGLLTALVTLLIAAWLSRRITAPVTALTKATQAIINTGDTTQLPVTTSDELGQMSAAFNQMATDLATQRTLRKRLIDDIAHELNTPLSVIQLEANGLQDDMQTPAEAATQIIQEVEMLRTLVYDLSWLAEVDLEALRLTLEPCSLSELLTREVERWQPHAIAQQTTLSLQPLPDLPVLTVDKTRLSQAMGNVLRNALQHTDADGQITVTATLGTKPNAGNASVIIAIEDDGVGIDAAELPHVFERFYRADQSRNRKTGGSGLGLAITQKVIESHNGMISVSSDGFGQGTIVRLELPIQ